MSELIQLLKGGGVMGTHATACLRRSEDNIVELVLSAYLSEVSGTEFRTLRMCGKHLYPLGQLSI